MAAVRHPDKVERWRDRIPDMRYPGGMRDSRPSGLRDSHSGGMRGSHPGGMRDSRLGGMKDFRPGRMSDAKCRKGPSACPREREPRGTFLGRIPQWVVVQAVQGGSGRLHNHQGKNCRVSLLKGLLQP